MDLILYNPKSKNSRGNIQTHRLIKKYRKENSSFRLKSILKIDNLGDFLNNNKQFEKVILLGGDGTIHNVVNDLTKTPNNTPIYIKRNGSGNDYLRSLKSNSNLPQSIMKATLDNTDSHYFINGTGIGIDGLIIDYVDHAKNKGKLTYFLSSIRAMLNYIPEDITVDIDQKQFHFKKAYLVAINNGKYIGGGMKITPKADISDEFLDVVIVHSIKKLFMLIVFSSIYLGLHTKLKKYVFSTKCKSIEVQFKTPQITQSDGERTDDISTLKAEVTNRKVHFKSY
jgi:diacylglycerol kinase family enzyme